MTTDTKEYFSNWKLKYESFKDDDLGVVFDKFKTLYPIYNRLYVEVFITRKAQGYKFPPRVSDYNKATTNVLDFLSPEVIYEELKQRNCLNHIDAMISLIHNRVFHINLNEEGTPQ